MRKLLQGIVALAAVTTALMAGGCSEGRSSGGGTPTVSGIAATGQAIVGQVHLKDSAATSRQLTGATTADGSYTFNVAGLTPPFLVKVDWTSSAGPQSLVSYAAGPGTANITPLSHLIVATAAGGTDPVAVFDGMTTLGQQVAGAIDAATNTVMAQLKPLMDQYGVTIHPLSGAFAANHVGLDALLDDVLISMSSGAVTVANRVSGQVIFTAPVANMQAGVFRHANMPTPSPGQIPVALDGAALYASNCAGCHGPLASSAKMGTSVASIQSAIAARIGGMGSLSSLTAQEIQAIVAALSGSSTPQTPSPAPAPAPTPAPAPVPADGTSLYVSKCAGCHGSVASTTKKGITLVRLQAAITNNVAGMGALSLLTLPELQAIVDALAPTTAPVPSPSPAPTPAPAPAPAPVDGASLYATNCAGCHGPLATSSKKNITLARLQNATTGNVGGMGFLSSLTSAQQQAIVAVLTAVSPTPAPAPAPTPAPTPPNGTTLYATSCAGCHGALASSTKGGATSTRITNAIATNAGGMGYLSTLTANEVTAIATALATVAPAPTPAPACGSCHGIPPSSGQHSKHRSRSCSTCHGTGYSTTTVNAASHNNGVRNLVTTIGWNASTRSCSNSCHGTKTW